MGSDRAGRFVRQAGGYEAFVRELTAKRRNRLFAYQAYLDLLPGATSRS